MSNPRVRSALSLALIPFVTGVSLDFASAQTRGLVVSSLGEARVIDFDSGAVVETIDLGGPRGRLMPDCEVSSDGRLGYVSDTVNFGIWVIDLIGSPALASGTNFIPLSDPPSDMTITRDGKFLVTASNSNIFFRLKVVDLETRTQIGVSDQGGMQSVEACDDGSSLIATSFSIAGARRFRIDENGQLTFTGDQLSASNHLGGVCAPGSDKAVLSAFNTLLIGGNAAIRSVSLPNLQTLDVLPLERSNPLTTLLSDPGDELYVRTGDLRGYRYDPTTGLIDDEPFFQTGGLGSVGGVAGGELMTLHPDGSRLYVTGGGRIDVFDTSDGDFLGSLADVPGAAICASPELVEPIVTTVTGGPYTVSEGGVVILSAEGSTSPTGGTLTYEWDFDFDGVVFVPDATGETVSFDTSSIIAPRTIVIAVRATDEAGNQTLATTTLDVLAITLEADAGGPYTVPEGGSILLSAEASTSSSGEALSFEWDLDGDGAFDDALGATPLFDASGLDGPLSFDVAVRVSDASSFDVAVARLDVLNVAPSIAALSDRDGVEGAVLAVAEISFQDPSGLDVLTLTLDWGDGSMPIVVAPAVSPLSVSHVYADDADYVVSVSVSDDDGGVSATQFLARVDNAAPMLGDLDVPVDPVPVGTLVTMEAPFTDAGTLDTHVAVVDWADGAVDAATVLETPFGPPGETIGLTGSLSAEHVYDATGVYTVTTTLTDDDGGTDVRSSTPIVVYDPDGPFVTGGGWIASTPGAYPEQPELEGKANFGFVAKYKKDAAVPTGQTEFQFHAAGLNFHAGSYDWLVVDGATALFQGTGSLNGADGFPFLITVTDGKHAGGGVDEFRIQIWEPSSGETVYDNATAAPGDTALEGGSIVIHTGGAATN